MYRKLFSSTVIYSVGPQLPKLVGFFMLPILTPHLTAFDYGVVGLIVAYLGILDAFKDLGLSLFLTNSFFQHPIRFKIIWRKILGFLQVWSLLFGLLLCPVLYYALPETEVNNFYIIILFSIVPIILFDPIITIGMRYLHLKQKASSFVSISIVGSLVAIVVNYYTIVHLKAGYIGFLAGTFSARLISFFIYTYWVFLKIKLFPIYKISKKWIINKLIIAAPLIPHFYSGYLLNISDRILLDFLNIDTVKIGVYSFAYTIGIYFSIIGKGIGEASTPFYMQLFKTGTNKAETDARNLTWVMQGLLVFVAFIVCLWMKEIFSFIAKNEELKSSYVYAIPVVMAYTYFPMYFGANAKLRFNQSTGSIWKITFVAGIFSVALNLILIPYWGIAGAALTTYIAYLFMGYRGYWLKEFRIHNKVPYKEMYWLLLNIGITSLVFVLKDINVIYKSSIVAFLILVLIYFGTVIIRSINLKK